MKTKPPIKIDTDIRQAVKWSKLSQAEICRLATMDPAHLCRFVAGVEGLSIGGLERLAGALGMDLILRRRKGASKCRTH